MKIRSLILLIFLIPFYSVFAQLTLEVCQERARQNYPLIKQFELIQKSADYSLSNAGKSWLPQLSMSAKATYQSEATSIKLPAMGLNVALPRDQYQAVLEAGQTIWDGGVVVSQKKIIKASANVEKEKLEVELYTLKDRINQMFFGLLLINEQLNQNETLQNELETNLNRVIAYMSNGVANQSDVDAVKVECLNNKQRRMEMLASAGSFKQMLGAMTGLQISGNEKLEKPVLEKTDFGNNIINRPELKLFDSQLDLFTSQEKLLHSGNLPKAGVFLQGGVGNPSLNMFKSGFSPFYIGGLRLSWSLSGLYTQKNNLNALKNNKNTVSRQRETFLFNNNLNILRQNSEIEKLSEQLKSDDEIINLRGNIKKASSVKVENGTLTITDLLRDINSESMAKNQKSIHEIQLLMSISNLRYSKNN